MSYALGQADNGGAWEDSAAAAWVRDQWATFLDLSRRIIDLQHRAALASQAARAQGNTLQADAARALIRSLGELNQAHGRAVEFGTPYMAPLGLAGFPIPLAIAAGVSTLAIWVAYLMRRFEYQEQALEALEAGTLTMADLTALEAQAGAAPAGLLTAGVSGLKWVAVGVLAFLALAMFREWQGIRENPPLDLLYPNPPGPMSERVHALLYEHADDGADYRHDFRPGVRMETLADGSVRLFHPSRRIWRDFP